jgi:hypothetical protein
MIDANWNVETMLKLRHGHNLRIFLGILSIAAAAPARQSNANVVQTDNSVSPKQTDQQPESTADALLRELRGKRPDVEVVPPASAPGGVWPIAEPKLLPEGAVLVERTGYVQATAESWRFVFHPPDDPPFIELLPNTSLEMMVRTAAAASDSVYFVVSGDVTTYHDVNHLLVRFARRATEVIDPEPTRDTDPTRVIDPSRVTDPSRDARSATSPTSDTPAPNTGTSTDRSPIAPASAEDTLSILQAQQPRDILLPMPPSGVPKGMELTVSAAATLRPEGTTVVNRPGRILRTGDWWTFVFESDHPDHPEPPMKLLASRGIELMAEAAGENQRGLVFLVSGEVTVFNGENYFLPTFVIRRINMGNLRP